MKKQIINLSILVLISCAAKAQTRVTLIEQFSNSSCGTCGAVSPTIYDFADLNPDKTIAISYHTAFPYNNDSMYFENPVESNQRVSYYSVAGVPYTVLDGNVFNGFSGNFVTNMANTVSNRSAIAPNYDIKDLSLNLSGNQLNGSFRFTSLSGANSTKNLVAHFVVIEKNVLKSSYAASPGANSETEYGYVMRKMIPNANGTNLNNKGLNGKDSISFNWTLANIKNVNELRVVVFVQNTSTKEIEQARAYSPSGSFVGVSEDSKSPLTNFSVYPNPLNDHVSISFGKEQFVEVVTVLNQLGQTVYSQKVNNVVDFVQLSLQLENGIYYLNISNGSQNAYHKIVVSN